MSLPKKCPVGPQRKRRSKSKNLEASVVRECLQLLKQHPDVIYVERRNTGAVQFQDGGFIRFGQKGAADIWCLIRAVGCSVGGQTVPSCHHVEIECKRADGKGRLSPDQKQFREFCESHRIPYILTISATELMGKIQAIILDEPGNI
jgi:hypothetical protein